MKILFISAHSFFYPGGVQFHTLNLKEEFKREGYNVKIIAPRELFAKEKKIENLTLFGNSIPSVGNASKINLSFELSPFSIKNFLKKEKPDILHFQNFGIFLPLQFLRVSEKLKKDFPHIKILTLHSFWEGSKILKKFNFLVNFLNKKILPKFDGVIGVSKVIFEQIKYGGPSRIIPNGVDLKIYTPKGNIVDRFKDDKINILFVGRIEERKGLIYLLKAFYLLKKKYKKIRLIIVGDGYQRKKMEEFVRRKKINDVFFEGEINEKKISDYYRTAHICCFPSIFGESFGMVLIEAMACGKPVVAFANKGYKQVIKGKGKSFLAKPRNIKELYQKLEILIKNEKIRKEMGEWGRKEAEKYSWDKIAKETLNFYKNIKELKQKNERN